MNRKPPVTEKVLRGIWALCNGPVASVLSGNMDLTELEGSVTRGDASDARAAQE